MTPTCIHGFSSDQCASCRTCVHGLTATRCPRCLAETAATAKKRSVAPISPAPAAEEHRGWEIFYVPALSGWQVRPPEADAVSGSYRSLFLARKAVDELIAHPPAASSSARRK